MFVFMGRPEILTIYPRNVRNLFAKKKDLLVDHNLLRLPLTPNELEKKPSQSQIFFLHFYVYQQK